MTNAVMACESTSPVNFSCAGRGEDTRWVARLQAIQIQVARRERGDELLKPARGSYRTSSGVGGRFSLAHAPRTLERNPREKLPIPIVSSAKRECGRKFRHGEFRIRPKRAMIPA